MRNLLIVSIVLGMAYPQFAACQEAPDKIVVGPVVLTQDVQGISISTSLTSTFSLQTQADGLHLALALDADLGDLQQKFPQLMGTIALPRDNCKSYTLVNPVVSLGNRQLKSSGGNAVVSISGEVDGWTCLQNPVPETYWDSTGCRGDLPFGGHYVFGCPKTRAASPIKNKSFTQPFDASIPVTLQKTADRSVGLVLGQPDIKLGGQFVAITNGALRLAGIDINDEARKALNKAIDPDKLILSIPKDYADLNPQIQTATFQSAQGVLSAHIDMTAIVSVSRLNDLLNGLVKGIKKP